MTVDSIPSDMNAVSSKKEEKTDKWQCGIKSLSAGVKHIYKTKEFSDAVYKVRGRVFRIHPLILGARSEKFKELFLGENPPDEVCDNCSEKGFEIFERFCYTDELGTTEPKEILEAYKISKVFEQRELMQECKDLIETWDISDDNVFTLANDAIDVEFLRERCFRYIAVNREAALNSPDFKNVSSITLVDLLDQNCFSDVLPMQLVKAVLNWSFTQFPNKNDKVHFKSEEAFFQVVRRSLIESGILGKIKLEKLNPEEILTLVADYPGLLTLEEAMKYQLHYKQPDKISLPNFDLL